MTTRSEEALKPVFHPVLHFFLSHNDPFLERIQRNLHACFKDEAQKWLSVSGAGMREKTGVKTVSGVQGSMI